MFHNKLVRPEEKSASALSDKINKTPKRNLWQNKQNTPQSQNLTSSSLSLCLMRTAGGQSQTEILSISSGRVFNKKVEYLPKCPLIPHWPCCVWPPFRYHSSFDDSSARIPPLMRKLRLFVCGGFVLPLKSATRKREIQPMEEFFSLLQLKRVENLLSALKDSNWRGVNWSHRVVFVHERVGALNEVCLEVG